MTALVQRLSASGCIYNKQRRTMSTAKLLDKTGREIHVGDVLKVFHFVARLRREKFYMYKYVNERITSVNGEERFKILHLEGNLESYYVEAINGRKLEGVEIVQGYGGVTKNFSFKDRPIIELNSATDGK